jgi:hypothetical protein
MARREPYPLEHHAHIGPTGIGDEGISNGRRLVRILQIDSPAWMLFSQGSQSTFKAGVPMGPA